MRLSPLPADPPVSVVVVARDAAQLLAVAVESALAQDHRSLREVVIAVAPSRDDTAEAAAALRARDPRVRIVDNPLGTTPVGLNLAVAASTGMVVARLDAQARLPSGYLARAVELLRTTGAANVGGLQVPVAAGGFAAGVAAAMRSWMGTGGARYRVGGAAGDTDTVYLGVFHREALEQVGGFDESLERNQDYELNYRLRAAGGRVHFSPELAVEYTPRSTPGALWQQYRAYGAWKRRVLTMHPGSFRWRQAAPPLLVAALGLSAVIAVVTRWPLPLALTAGTYGAAITAGAASAAKRPAEVPATAAALVVMHTAWGIGFVFGRPRR